ncbi:hypothetical protein M430DRAFT_37165 [Amorphotheca resinae ATCC 22711]|uniref:Uncharacterized protein n=1 Tax=Amorphotheca resinae ATCC 22711 TaxID=857342 RepID=A0A2T3ART8_AMORE|nr:hypothetical protein M430DRAFT_37165 [Amorphotheca resinae ATCC 22711]PSS09077.1 hypothetical protein M430DRAFT_37165 [Amorphotheca resinae ATCC 22711]
MDQTAGSEIPPPLRPPISLLPALPVGARIAMPSLKKPDWILILLICLVYLELSWLIVVVWRSCN